MSAIDQESFPKGALIAAGALVAISIFAAGTGRYLHLHAPRVASAPAVAPVRAIDLKFADEHNGSVLVRRAETGALVAVVPPNSGGFLRGVLRGLARERMMRGIGSEPPFRLAQWQDGRVEIQDTADGGKIDLNAFGPTNKAAFVKLLPGASPA
jgi:putative photosynthetic complex assembly protein